MKLTRKMRELLSQIVQMDRSVNTLQEISEICGISMKNLLKYMENEEFRALVFSNMKLKLTTFLPGVTNSLIDQALMGSYKHQALYFEITGFHEKTQRVESEVSLKFKEGNPFQTEEERRAYIQNLLGAPEGSE